MNCPKGHWWIAQLTGLLLFPLLPALLKGLAVSLVASLVQVVNHEGIDGGLRRFVLIVIIVRTLANLGSHNVHDSFSVRPFANIVDAMFASLRPAVVVEVLVGLEHSLSNQLQCMVTAHPRQNGVQTDCLAAYLTLLQAPDSCLLEISSDGDEKAFRRTAC